MGLVPQQINNILGELFCPFYFILGTFFKKRTKLLFSSTHLFDIITVSPMHRLQKIPSLTSKHTHNLKQTYFSLCRWFSNLLIKGRTPGSCDTVIICEYTHTYVISSYKWEVFSLVPCLLTPISYIHICEMIYIQVSVFEKGMWNLFLWNHSSEYLHAFWLFFWSSVKIASKKEYQAPKV